MLLAFLGIGIMGATGFYAGWQLFSGELEDAVSKRLEQAKRKPKNGLVRLSAFGFRPLILPYVVQWKMEDWRKKTRRRIISAGLEEEIDPDELMSMKIFLGFVVPIFLSVYLYVMGMGMPWWMIGLMITMGYAYPSIWVGGARKARHEAIKLQLPFVIDLLTLSTEAGLDFIGALQKVVEKTKPGPLVDEIARMLQQIQLGTSRAESLRDLGWRIDLQEISSLVAVLVTADQMGSPLGNVLRVQSELIRTQRFSSAEKKGAAASQKLLFPLIFFIMPAVFIMIFGPIILAFFGVK